MSKLSICLLLHLVRHGLVGRKTKQASFKDKNQVLSATGNDHVEIT